MGESSPAFTVPRVRTSRLLLREVQLSDFDAYAENMADPVAMEHLSGVLDRRHAWRAFAAQAGFWMLQGAGWWGVELSGTGALVGSVGAFFRETSPDLELGWTIYRRHWGQGFATEAAAAALAFARAAYPDRRVVAHISKENGASIAVSRHLGLSYAGDVSLYGETIGLYTLARSAS